MSSFARSLSRLRYPLTFSTRSSSRVPHTSVLTDCRGPFTATGTYSFNPNCKIKPKIPAPCSIQSTNVCRFSLEEDATIARQTTVKIYYEGELAWYEIISPHPSYAPIYANMLLKAEIWLWIQYRRATILTNNKSKLTGPSLKQVLRELPFRFKSRIADPIDAFHHYFIECIIQSNYFEKTMIAGPEGLDPRWMESQFASDLQYKYPVRRFLVKSLTIGCLAIGL